MKQLSELSDDSKVWIYQADRVLNNSEVSAISKELENFLADWSAHGAALEAGGEVLHSRFVVIAVDEEKALASGCSIDKSVHFMKLIGEKYQVDFFNRMLTVYEENGELLACQLHEFWARRKAGLINDATVVFDNLVKNLGEYKRAWKTTFEKSWHAEMWGR